MKRMSIFLFIGVLVGLFSCEEPNYPDNIYDENVEGLPDPVISSVSPDDSAFAGIGILTITGENFSTANDRNLVYFNGNAGIVQSSATTQLVVKAPNLVADSVKIQLAVIGAYNFAEWDNYKLYSPVNLWGGFDQLATSLWGIEVDNNENLIVSDQKEEILYRVFSTGDKDSVIYADYGPRNRADAIRLGPNNQYYMAMNYKKVYRIEEGGNEIAFASVPGNVRATSLDFDEYGNLYVGGKSNILYKINVLNGETTLINASTLPEGILIIAIRVFDGYVYSMGKYSGTDTNTVTNGIWRNEILNADSLGKTELVIDWDAALGGNATKPLDLTFASDGVMIIGVDYVDPSSITTLGPGLYELQPPYFAGTPTPIYEEVYSAPASKITWGNGNYLYINNRNTASEPEGVSWDYDPVKQRGLYRIDMAKTGAPYYGRSL